MAQSRDEGRPNVTYLLLLVTALIQLYISTLQVADAIRLFDIYALSPARLFEGVGVAGLVTYMFLHEGWLHFLVNAIALWGAGVIVEKEIGSATYALVYLTSGFAAGLVHSFLHMSSEVPLVGSSGAIFGIIAVLFLLMPFKITFATLIPLPAVLVGVMLSAIEISAFWLQSDVGIAHDAHLSGFVFGCVSAFVIDTKRALKGLVIALFVFAVLLYLGIYLGLI